MNKIIKVHTDGACLGNPGTKGIGAIVDLGDDVVWEMYGTTGKGTNNEAEYEALIETLKWLDKNNYMADHTIAVSSDSQLMVRQLTGAYKVKKPSLHKLWHEALSLCMGHSVVFRYVPREKNGWADMMSKIGAKIKKEPAIRWKLWEKEEESEKNERNNEKSINNA